MLQSNGSGSTIPRYSITGSGPLLVSIPGLDGTGKLFFKQLPDLAKSYRVATFPLREQGLFTYRDLTGDIADIIKLEGGARATIVGESFGGTIALSFALHYPELVERLVIINSFPRFRGRLRIRLAVLLTSMLPSDFIWPGRWAAATLGLRADGVSAEDRLRVISAIRSVDMRAYRRRLQLIEQLDLDEQLGKITAPTLLIAAEKDLLIRSVEEAKRMSKAIPNATVRVIKGAGHACLLGEAVCLGRILAEHSS
jgi:pimeloyl-ACP methyl ester carboxylesterase